MFSFAAFLLLICIFVLSNIISYYIGKYNGIMEADYEDRLDTFR
jgi:hypothetical protein